MPRTAVPRVDLHMHSEFSACAQDVTVEKDILRAEMLGVTRLAITDHGDHLRPKWIPGYLLEVEGWRKGSSVDVLTGIEAQILPDGRPAVEKSLLKAFDVVIGGLHELPSQGKAHGDALLPEYERAVLGALEGGWMLILAHATDVAWEKVSVPEDLARRLAETARDKGVAVELNFHHRDPTLPFLGACVEAGVRVTPTSDAHRLDEIGHYEWHAQMVERLNLSREPVWYTGPD